MKMALKAENETGWRFIEVADEAEAFQVAAREFNARWTVDPSAVKEIEDCQEEVLREATR